MYAHTSENDIKSLATYHFCFQNFFSFAFKNIDESLTLISAKTAVIRFHEILFLNIFFHFFCAKSENYLWYSLYSLNQELLKKCFKIFVNFHFWKGSAHGHIHQGQSHITKK